MPLGDFDKLPWLALGFIALCFCLSLLVEYLL